jgi:hypothetical protein
MGASHEDKTRTYLASARSRAIFVNAQRLGTREHFGNPPAGCNLFQQSLLYGVNTYRIMCFLISLLLRWLRWIGDELPALAQKAMLAGMNCK